MPRILERNEFSEKKKITKKKKRKETIYFWVAELKSLLLLFLALLVLRKQTHKIPIMRRWAKCIILSKMCSFHLFAIKFIVHASISMERSGHAWIPKQIPCKLNLLTKCFCVQIHRPYWPHTPYAYRGYVNI